MTIGTSLLTCTAIGAVLLSLPSACGSDMAAQSDGRTGAGGGGTGGGSTAGSGGQGGMGPGGNVNYGICSMTSTTLFRIERDAMTCTFLVLAPAADASCASGVMISDWCLTGAGISKEVAACDALQMPSAAVAATTVAGTFRTHVEDPAPRGAAVNLADFDLTLSFPVTTDLAAGEHLVGANCLVACLKPTSACGT
jgi:hypothetical protein